MIFEVFRNLPSSSGLIYDLSVAGCIFASSDTAATARDAYIIAITEIICSGHDVVEEPRQPESRVFHVRTRT